MPRISMSGFVYSREAWELAKDKLSRSEPRWHDASRLRQAITEVKDLVRSKNCQTARNIAPRSGVRPCG